MCMPVNIDGALRDGVGGVDGVGSAASAGTGPNCLRVVTMGGF